MGESTQETDHPSMSRDGYVRVRPTWHSKQIHQMDAGGFGRQVGGLIGAMCAPLVLLAVGERPFWQILVGIVIGFIVGAAIGHFVSKAIWGTIKKEVPAINPRQKPATELAPGDWMLTQNDGTDRAIRVRSAPEEAADPQAAMREAIPHVRVLTSTGRHLTLPARQDVTIIDLGA